MTLQLLGVNAGMYAKMREIPGELLELLPRFVDLFLHAHAGKPWGSPGTFAVCFIAMLESK